MFATSRRVDLARLVERCQKGDAEAWHELVDLFGRHVYSIPRRYRLSADDAEDVFQATFASLVQRIDHIEDPATLPKWLAVAATRLSLRTKRLNSRSASINGDEAGLIETLASEEADAEAEGVRSAEAWAVREAIENVGGKCTPLLTLLYLEEDLSYDDISARTGIPVGSIGPTRSRCLQKVRKILLDMGIID